MNDLSTDVRVPNRSRSRAMGCVAFLLFAVLSVFVLARASTAIYDKLRPRVAAQAEPTRVEVLRLEPEPFEHTVDVSGSLEPIHSVDVFPKLGGRVVKLHVGLGDVVRAGDPLASVESPEYALMAEKAEEGLSIATEAAQVAENSLERLQEVRGKLGEGALSEQDFEQARVQVEGARTQAEVARLDRDLARQMIRNATMTAPVDGVISQVNARLGGMVGKEYPSFHVADTSRLVLRCQVGDLDLAQVAVGQPVRLASNALPGVELVGEVTAVSPSLDAWTRRAPVEITLDNPDGRVPGNLFAHGVIVTGRDTDALLVPIEAVQRDEAGATVQVVREGVVANVPVEVEGQRAGRIAVRGLSKGDLLVLPGPAHLAEGEPVNAVERMNG